MNKTKKIIITAFSILAALSVFTGCAKKSISQVTNDPAVEQLLYGTWQLNTKSNIELYSDANTENQKYMGNAVIISGNNIEFSQNQNYKMTIASTVETLNLIDDAPVSKEELLPQIENSMVINGTFSVDSKHIELLSQTVVLNGKQTFSSEDYAKIDPSYGKVKQILKWNIYEDSLELADLSDNVIAVYNKN